jgi:uncharacterized membrane protein
VQTRIKLTWTVSGIFISWIPIIWPILSHLEHLRSTAESASAVLKHRYQLFISTKSRSRFMITHAVCNHLCQGLKRRQKGIKI